VLSAADKDRGGELPLISRTHPGVSLCDGVCCSRRRQLSQSGCKVCNATPPHDGHLKTTTRRVCSPRAENVCFCVIPRIRATPLFCFSSQSASSGKSHSCCLVQTSFPNTSCVCVCVCVCVQLCTDRSR